MRFSPAIDPQLIRWIDQIDDGRRSRASIWRELGRRARRRGLLQPSYESVRRLVNAGREPRELRARPGARAPLWRRPRIGDPSTLLLAIVAADVVARPVADPRRARDNLSRVMTRAPA